jgi:hypothetical protein
MYQIDKTFLTASQCLNLRSQKYFALESLLFEQVMNSLQRATQIPERIYRLCELRTRGGFTWVRQDSSLRPLEDRIELAKKSLPDGDSDARSTT